MAACQLTRIKFGEKDQEKLALEETRRLEIHIYGQRLQFLFHPYSKQDFLTDRQDLAAYVEENDLRENRYDEVRKMSIDGQAHYYIHPVNSGSEKTLLLFTELDSTTEYQQVSDQILKECGTKTRTYRLTKLYEVSSINNRIINASDTGTDK
jgi:hypothetical protein